MKCIFALLSVFFLTQSVFTQTVTILDEEDGKPVADVAVYNESRTQFCYSNPSGKANMSVFSENQPIFFQHFSYDRVSYTLAELRDAGWVVRLKAKVFEVEEFIVSANRWEQKSDEVPNLITTIGLPAIRLSNPQTTADLVSLGGDVFVQKSQLGGGSPMIRGFATNRVLIVVDGVRMNNAIYREGNIQNIISLDPNVIDRTEIIFGPGAIIYGSDAIGGVMDFHTKKALYSTGEKLYYKSDAMARYSSASNEQTYHLDFNLGSKKVAFLSSFTWSDFNDLRMGSWKHPEYLRNEYQIRTATEDMVVSNKDPRIQVASGYSQLNAMNKLRFRIGSHTDISVANHHSHLSDVPRYDRLIQMKGATLRYGDWYYGPQVWMMNDVTVSYSNPNRLFNEMRFVLARQDYRESRHDRKIFDDILNEQAEKVAIWSLNLDLEKPFSEGKSLVYYGAEYVRNDIKSTADTRDILTDVLTPAGSRYPNGKNIYSSYSVYGGYKNNITGRFTLNAGIRYNFVSLDSEIADNSFYHFPFTTIKAANDAVTGSAGIVFRPDEKNELSLNLSTGFRAPNLDDLGKVFESAPGVVVVPNPDLGPEYVYSADLGIAKKLGSVLHTELTGFFSYLDNAMVRREFQYNGEDSILYQGEMSKVYAMDNAGFAVVYGTQVKVELRPVSNLRIKSTLTLTGGHDDTGEPLRHVPPVFGSTHIIYQNHAFRADLYSVYNGSKTFDKLAPSERDKPYLYATDADGNPWCPGWFTLNLKMVYTFANRLEVTTGIENILDLRYRPYSSGIVSPGRNFIAALRIML